MTRKARTQVLQAKGMLHTCPGLRHRVETEISTERGPNGEISKDIKRRIAKDHEG